MGEAAFPLDFLLFKNDPGREIGLLSLFRIAIATAMVQSVEFRPRQWLVRGFLFRQTH